ERLAWLIAYFDTLTHLEVVCDQLNLSSLVGDLLQLIKKWGSTLRSIKFFFGTLKGTVSGNLLMESEATFRQFLAFLNSPGFIPNFRYLAIESLHPLNPRGRNLEFTLLSQLKSFYFNTPDNPCILKRSMKRFATGNLRLRSITIGNPFRTNESLQKFCNLSSEFRSKFTCINVMKSLQPFDCDALKVVVDNFASLTTLSIKFNKDTSMLSKLLAPLTSLTYLQLTSGS